MTTCLRPPSPSHSSIVGPFATLRSVDADPCDEPGLPCISSSQQQVCDDRAEARAQQDALVHKQCPHTACV
jgi:hypothetical protein